MRALPLIGIVAHRLSLKVNARIIVLRFRQPRHLRRRKIACENDRTVGFVDVDFLEILVIDAAMVQQTVPQQRLRHAQNLGQPAHRGLDVLDFGRNERAHERRAAAHHHGPVPVDDQTARRRDRDEFDLVGARRRGEIFPVENLDLREPEDDRGEREHERCDEARQPR